MSAAIYAWGRVNRPSAGFAVCRILDAVFE